MMQNLRTLVVVSLVGLLALPVASQDLPAPKPGSDAASETATEIAPDAGSGPANGKPAAGDEACRSKTDGCQVCNVGPDGATNDCSLPGIACTREGGWRCNDAAATAGAPSPSAPDGKSQPPAPAQPANRD